MRARAFGLEPIGWSRSLTPRARRELGIGHAASLEELASRSHVLSLHLALNERTRNIVSAHVLLEAAAPRHLHQHGARGPRRRGGAARAVQERGLRVGLDVFAERAEAARTSFEPTRLRPRATADGGLRLRHAPHRRVDRPGPARHRDRDGARHPLVLARGRRAQRRQRRRRRRRRASSSSFAWSTRWGRSPTCSTSSSATASTSRRSTNTVFDGGGARMREAPRRLRPSEACLAEICAFEEVLHVDMVHAAEPGVTRAMRVLAARGAPGRSRCCTPQGATATRGPPPSEAGHGRRGRGKRAAPTRAVRPSSRSATPFPERRPHAACAPPARGHREGRPEPRDGHRLPARRLRTRARDATGQAVGTTKSRAVQKRDPLLHKQNKRHRAGPVSASRSANPSARSSRRSTT